MIRREYIDGKPQSFVLELSSAGTPQVLTGYSIVFKLKSNNTARSVPIVVPATNPPATSVTIPYSSLVVPGEKVVKGTFDITTVPGNVFLRSVPVHIRIRS